MVKLFNTCLIIIGCLIPCFHKAQKVYHKRLTDSILKQTPDSSQRVHFVGFDSVVYRNHINYILQFYPTLKYRKITIKAVNASSPLAARPTFWSIFKRAEKRDYLILVSKKTETMIDSILLHKLSLNSQVGVLSHEMSHIYDFSTSHIFHFVFLVFNHASRKKMNAFEYSTDKLTIEQGLGYPLLSWSKEVLDKLKIENWKGVKGYESFKRSSEERYMKPETIQHFINDFPIYQQMSYR